MAEMVERVARLEEQFDGVAQRLDNLDASIIRVEDSVNARLERVEDRLDTGLTEVNQSIARVEVRLDANMTDLRASITQLGGRLDAGLSEMRAEMRTQFRWFMGGLASAMGAMLLTTFGRMLFGS